MGQQDGQSFFDQALRGKNLSDHDLDLQSCDLWLGIIGRVDLEKFSQVGEGSIPTGGVCGLDSIQIDGLSLQRLETQSMALGDVLSDTGIVLEGNERAKEEEVELMGCLCIGGGAGPRSCGV